MPEDQRDRAQIREPWLGFFLRIDEALEGPVEIHCIGGFALSVLAGWPRPTGDVDIVSVLPVSAGEVLHRIAGQGSDLARTTRISLQMVSVADLPRDYSGRLLDVAPPECANLRIRIVEAHDLALSKLDRNLHRDREDVRYLAERSLIQAQVLKERFEREFRPYALNESRSALTLELWLDELFGESQG
jgi:hypothetical protein